MKTSESSGITGERGSAVIEAVFILPLAIFMVFLLIFLSLFYYEKAALQGALQTSLVYYKNELTDNFIENNEKVVKDVGAEGNIGVGNSYNADEGPKNPYVNLNKIGLLTSDEEMGEGGAFSDFFKSASSGLIMNNYKRYASTGADSDGNIAIEFHCDTRLICYKLSAKATQHVNLPIRLGLGVSKKWESGITLTAEATVIANDNDSSIQNIDMILQKTKLEKVFANIGEKAGEFSKKVQDILASH